MRITDTKEHAAAVDEVHRLLSRVGDEVVIDLTDPVPSMTPLVEERVEVHQRLSWSTPDDGRTWTARLALEVWGAPIRAEGTLVIEPSGGGSRTTVSVDLSSGMPALGGRLLAAVRPVAEQQLRHALELLDSQLTRLPHG